MEDRCFTTSDDSWLKHFKNDEELINDNYYRQAQKYNVKKIIAEKPDYLQIVDLRKFISFKKDSIKSKSEEIIEKKWEEYDSEFKTFNDLFSKQFTFSNQQKIGNIEYAFGKNQLGFWLCKIENEKPSAYFLGLSFSHYYINKFQEKPMINNGFLELEGSFVQIIRVPGLPGYDDYSAIEDGKLFKIKLEDLIKDSDNDGYNDIFEKNFGLNPTNKDTDGDGVNDFLDLNPLFKSENNKFTRLYEMLLPDYGSENLRNSNYYFEVFISDCDYFHQINPKYHVLFIPESLQSKTDYQKITDVSSHGMGKIKKNKNNSNIFYIKKWGSSSSIDYSAEYKNGKWILEISGGYVI
ncbi:thrombospondin type 3 repeat-containing protein [Chryseobacterium echinoideorum]|uniref:thrombospondin type 3 repeat-containing protein n=1 Tax=Chryseobacterium echinoideorum TaxID=1549648 RepID=UPI001E4A0898|nr:thrombospondin type 3 repeat-containing protein [Chryseobacterium echinoideorum]